MSGKIGRYTYRDEKVLKEFIDKLVKAIATRKGSKIVRKLKQDPVLQKKIRDIEQNLIQIQKDRKSKPEVDKFLTSLGY